MAAAYNAIHEDSHRQRGRTPLPLSAGNQIRMGLYHREVFWIQMTEKPLLDLLKWNEKATHRYHPFQRHKSNYTFANKLPPNISAYMTFWSGSVKICCTASMGGLQNALSFTDSIHHLNLHKGLATWQQNTFQSQHKTPAPSMTALRTHKSTGLEWKIKARIQRLMVLPSYSRVTGHWRIYLAYPDVANKHIRKEEWEICRTPWGGDRRDWWFSSVYMHVYHVMRNKLGYVTCSA